jgi:hypothetical protein
VCHHEQQPLIPSSVRKLTTRLQVQVMSVHSQLHKSSPQGLIADGSELDRRPW